MKALTQIQSGVALVALFLVIALSGCNNATNNNQKANAAAADTIKKEVTLNPELKTFFTPFQLLSL